MSPEDPSKNPFIRFRQHVDDRITTAMQGLVGLPSVVSRSLSSTWSDARNPPCRHPGSAGPDDNRSPSSRPQQQNFSDGVQWASWAHTSPYSPFNLDDLPPPLPAHGDGDGHTRRGDFTYADAFEDLLAASSGRPLMDLRERRAENRRRERLAVARRDAFNAGDPWSHLARWQRLGLLGAYHPAAAELPSPREPRDPWDHVREVEAAFEREWSDLAPRLGGHLFEELDRFFKSHHDLPRPPRDESDPPDGTDNDSRPPPPTRRTTDDDPSEELDQTFDDLYAQIKSDFADAAGPFATLARVFREAAEESTRELEHQKHPASRAAGSRDGRDGLRREVTSEEHRDAMGNLHTRTTTRFFDEAGSEVRCEESVTVRFGEGPSPQQPERGGEPRGPAVERTGTEKKPGWFWK